LLLLVMELDMYRLYRCYHRYHLYKDPKYIDRHDYRSRHFLILLDMFNHRVLHAQPDNRVPH